MSDGSDEEHICNFKNGQHGRDGKNGKDGRPGRDGRDGIDGQRGPQGPQGLEGPQGPQGPQGGPASYSPVTSGMGLFDTSTYSFVNSEGVSGMTYSGSTEFLNIINRKYLPLTYIGIIWSAGDTVTKCTINLKDVTNKVLLSFVVGPSQVANTKNVYEIYPNPPLTTLFTRLIKFTIQVEPINLIVYSIMIGFN